MATPRPTNARLLASLDSLTEATEEVRRDIKFMVKVSVAIPIILTAGAILAHFMHLV